MIREKKEQVKEEVEKKRSSLLLFLCMVVRFFGKKEQAGTLIREKKEQAEGEKYEKRSKLKISEGKKGASWYIDQGLKKGKKGEGERQKKG